MEPRGVHYAEAMLRRERIQLRSIMLLLWLTYPEIRCNEMEGFRDPEIQTLYNAVMLAPEPPEEKPWAPSR